MTIINFFIELFFFSDLNNFVLCNPDYKTTWAFVVRIYSKFQECCLWICVFKTTKTFVHNKRKETFFLLVDLVFAWDCGSLKCTISSQEWALFDKNSPCSILKFEFSF